MSQTTRCKMRLNCTTTNDYGPGFGGPQSAKTLEFSCAYDASIPEDQRFALATPSGKAEFRIDTPEALKMFVPGKSYYFDVTPAD